MRVLYTALTGLLLLQGCGSTKDEPGVHETLATMIKARREALKTQGLPKKKPPKLSRNSIAHIDKPLMRIEVQKLGFISLFAQVAQNGPYRTYLNNSKMSVTFNGSVITATRGFGLDLLSQGLSIKPSDMFLDDTPVKFFTRTQQQLENIKQVVKISYSCTMVKGEIEALTIVDIDYELAEYTETCKNDSRAFKNTYWVDDETKEVWKTSQSIGQQAGFLVVEILIQ